MDLKLKVVCLFIYYFYCCLNFANYFDTKLEFNQHKALGSWIIFLYPYAFAFVSVTTTEKFWIHFVAMVKDLQIHHNCHTSMPSAVAITFSIYKENHFSISFSLAS